MNREQKVERFAEVEFERHAQNTIIPDDAGGYIVFGKYHLQPHNQLWQVTENDRLIHQFHNKRTAMAWCVCDKYKQYQRANNIRSLDHKRQLLLADVSCRKTMGDKSRHQSFYEIVNMKIEPKVANLELVTRELEKCIISAKYLQIRGFNNETV